jgi:hypothetical protein
LQSVLAGEPKIEEGGSTMKFEKPRLFLFQKRNGRNSAYHGEFSSVREAGKHVSKFKEEDAFYVRIIVGTCDGEDIGKLAADYPPETRIFAMASYREQGRGGNIIIFDNPENSAPKEPDVYLFLSLADEFHFNRRGKMHDKAFFSKRLAEFTI